MNKTFTFLNLLVVFGMSVCFCGSILADDVDDTLGSMTIEQKVAQMFMVSIFGPIVNEPDADMLRTWQPGGIILLGHNVSSPQSLAIMLNEYQKTVTGAGGVPMFIAVDHEGGTVNRLINGFTIFPVPMLLTATSDPELVYETGRAMARELLAVGINMNLAPVSDLLTKSDNLLISRRSFGTDPEQVAPVLQAFVRGLQDEGVLATGKHFPGHGDTDADSHVELPILNFGVDDLKQRELLPFQAMIDSDVAAVMTAHIWFPQLDHALNMPASLSYNVISRLLKKELGYEGLVITDALDMDAIELHYTSEQAAIQAIQAGQDIILLGAHVGPQKQARVMQAVVDAVHDGIISEERLDRSVRKILEYKEKFGIIDWELVDVGGIAGKLQTPETEDILEQLFREGTTIVKDADHRLPLSESAPTATIVYPASRPSIRRLCEPFAPEPTEWFGVSAEPTSLELAWLSQSAEAGNTIVVFVQDVEHNAAMRNFVYGLPPEQAMVVALWSPYDVLYFPDVHGQVVAYSPLSAAFPAVCEVLFGNVPATGQLPINLDDFVVPDLLNTP